MKNKHIFYEFCGDELCFYGCGKKANYIVGLKVLKPCCSKYYSQCEEIRKKNKKSNTGKKRAKGKESKLYGRKRPHQSLLMKKNNPMFVDEHKRKVIEVTQSEEYRKEMSAKIKNVWKDEKFREYHKNILIKKRRRLSDDEISEAKKYYMEVERFTRESLKKFGNIINPNNQKIGIDSFHVDHIFSVIEGFKHNIDPKIIGSYVNLQVIDCKLNLSKHVKCWIAEDELLSRYESAYENNI